MRRDGALAAGPDHHASPTIGRVRSVPRRPGATFRTRVQVRWAWQPDKAVRLTTVAGLATVEPGWSVADVGGRGHEMARLLQGCRVISLNVEPPCDVLVPPVPPLPFADGSFDVVTSTDVLEHLPGGARAAHLAELVRLARRRVVICFPAGSETKDASERRQADHLAAAYDVRPAFLEEHLEHGLPRADDVVAAITASAPQASVEVLFHDGVEASERVLVDAFDAIKGHRPGALLRSARAWSVRPSRVLTHQPSPANDRAFVVVDLAR